MEKELKILTATVTIQLITVDGKRMTKSVFNQIQTQNCFNEDFDFIGDSLLGYVNDNGKYLLWISNGELRKTTLWELIHFVHNDFQIRLPKEYANVNWFPESFRNEYYNKLLYKSDHCNLDQILKLQQKCKDFLIKITGTQLYISI